ncbi:ANR40-like protein [Mya arenaria]|uniref:ANR40-like protein n=1 Tax=Mya arenaria TaxID=6604 RepID=A0ABY7DJZ9_MYAAR|nr:ANR40-like protein [Mya arenaria]
MNVEAAEKEEKLRESACIGDLDQVIKLVEHDHVNVNSQNNINGWTALHWACKRNHIDIVKYLLAHDSGGVSEAPSFAITPSYLKFPVFPYASRDPVPPAIDSQHHAPALVNGHTGPTLRSDPNELVLKARVAYLTDRDFIEVELSRQTLTFEALLTMLTRELGVDRSLVHKIRKLPDTVLRKDKDVARLVDFQEVELVLTNRAMSSSSRGYASDLSDSFKHEQILY